MAALQYVHIPNYSAIIFRRSFADLKLSNALISRSNEWLAKSDAKWKGDEMSWRFPSGATISFGYLRHDRDKLRYQSAEYQFIGFDELTQFPHEAYSYLFSRLRKLKDSPVPLRMRAASNPGGEGHDWVKHKFITDPSVDCVFVPATLQDNPHLDHATYIQSLMHLLPLDRERLLKGDWDVTDDRIVTYEDLLKCTANCLWSMGYVPQGTRVRPELYIGMDIGRTQDLSVIWVWDLVGDVAHTRHIVTMKNKRYSEQKDMVHSLMRMYGRYVVKLMIDKGGIGNDLAEEMELAYPAIAEGVQLSPGRMGQLGQALGVAVGEGKVRIPDDEEVRTDWRKVRSVDISRDVPRLDTDRDKSGHGDRFWSAALGFWPLHEIIQRPRVQARLPQVIPARSGMGMRRR